jgi:hypothetical protein
MARVLTERRWPGIARCVDAAIPAVPSRVDGGTVAAIPRGAGVSVTPPQ